LSVFQNNQQKTVKKKKRSRRGARMLMKMQVSDLREGKQQEKRERAVGDFRAGPTRKWLHLGRED
jgi:hypothetical protein